MIRTRFAVNLLLRRAICVLFISSAAAERLHCQPPATATSIPPADCPYIAVVCDLIADPAVRNYVGFAEYAWDFNAADRVELAEPAPHPVGLSLARAEGE